MVEASIIAVMRDLIDTVVRIIFPDMIIISSSNIIDMSISRAINISKLNTSIIIIEMEGTTTDLLHWHLSQDPLQLSTLHLRILNIVLSNNKISNSNSLITQVVSTSQLRPLPRRTDGREAINLRICTAVVSKHIEYTL